MNIKIAVFTDTIAKAEEKIGQIINSYEDATNIRGIHNRDELRLVFKNGKDRYIIDYLPKPAKGQKYNIIYGDRTVIMRDPDLFTEILNVNSNYKGRQVIYYG